MVHIKDDGIFEEPLEKIWRFVGDENAPHNHALLKSRKVVRQEGTTAWIENQVANPDGKGTHKETWKLTMNPPKGYSVEYVDGPMKGSKFSNSYTPLGPSRTRVEVDGNFIVPGTDEAGARKSVLGFLEMVFNEDTQNLKRYK